MEIIIMLNRLFGNYLVQKEILTQEQLDQLLPVSKENKADISTIAVINRVLTPVQVSDFLAVTKVDKNQFGELAENMRLISEDVREQLVTYQSNAFMIFAQILNDKGILTLEQLISLMDNYAKEKHFTPQQLEALILDDLEQEIAIFIPVKNLKIREHMVTLVRTVRRLLDRYVYLEKGYSADFVQIDRYASQVIDGDVRFRLYLTGDTDQLLGVANYFADGNYQSVNEDALDNVAEFINCVNGLYATSLSYDEISVDMGTPEFDRKGPFISNGQLYIIPIHINGCLLRIVYEMFQ